MRIFKVRNTYSRRTKGPFTFAWKGWYRNFKVSVKIPFVKKKVEWSPFGNQRSN